MSLCEYEDNSLPWISTFVAKLGEEQPNMLVYKYR